MRTRTSPLTKRPTRNDVARHANVSGWTVSHVLNGDLHVSISDETRARVLESAKMLGYRPNSNARALATGRNLTVGFWMCFQYSQYRARVLQRMQNVTKNSDFELIIRDIEEELSRDTALSNAYKVPVDGIVAFDTPHAGKTFARTDSEMSTPFVSMGAYWTEDRDYVGTDLYAGTCEAIRHLIETGRRRIVYLLPVPDTEAPAEARYRAYNDVMAAAGLEPCLLRTEDLAMSTAWTSTIDFVRQNPDVDAIFCHNDDMAFGAHRALSDLGREIGKDIALVGCDGIEETEYLSPPLSTVVQPIDEMCELAWEFLHNRINDPSLPPQQRILQPRLVIRASSGA